MRSGHAVFYCLGIDHITTSPCLVKKNITENLTDFTWIFRKETSRQHFVITITICRYFASNPKRIAITQKTIMAQISEFADLLLRQYTFSEKVYAPFIGIGRLSALIENSWNINKISWPTHNSYGFKKVSIFAVKHKPFWLCIQSRHGVVQVWWQHLMFWYRKVWEY